MKKILALMLALIMVLSMCACGNKDSADGTKPSDSAQTPTGGNTQAPTDGKPDATQPGNENNATEPSGTTPAPTTPAPTTPAPTACSHSWKDATCTAPKTCTKCGATEGSVLAHKYEGGSCTKCGAEDNRVPFSDHVWELDIIDGANLTRLSLDCYKGTGSMFASLWSETVTEGDAMQLNGKAYYPAGYGGESGIFYMEDDDTVTITVDNAETATQGTLTLKRANATQYTVTAVSGTIINDSITKVLTVGSAFTVFILNIE